MTSSMADSREAGASSWRQRYNNAVDLEPDLNLSDAVCA